MLLQVGKQVGASSLLIVQFQPFYHIHLHRLVAAPAYYIPHTKGHNGTRTRHEQTKPSALTSQAIPSTILYSTYH